MPPLPQRKFLPHEIPSWIPDGAGFFLTICTVPRGKDQLCHQQVADIIFEAVQYRQNACRWYVHLLLLMPDHLHAVVSFPREEHMVAVVANFKEITCKRANVRWQRDFFDHRLRTTESFWEKVSYIRNNPVRKGFVANPHNWRWVWPKSEAIRGGPSGPALPGI
ncbi:MAG TPA: transposase [Candidatus Didemnitutus sp.]|nr:transposase [Candidatus Didemnitutus sp.]